MFLDAHFGQALIIILVVIFYFILIFLKAKLKRVKYEKDLSETEREKPKGFGLQMVDYNNIQGMNIPQYDFPPKVRSDLLHQIQDILFKHGEIDGKSDIENYLDLSFVEEAMKNINK